MVDGPWTNLARRDYRVGDAPNDPLKRKLVNRIHRKPGGGVGPSLR